MYAGDPLLISLMLKNFLLEPDPSQQYDAIEIKGTYYLANLLQELFLARQKGQTHVTIKHSQITENAVHRLSRLIKETFWDRLTRQIDSRGIEAAAPDTKSVKSQPRIYVPPGAPEQHAYYCNIAKGKPDFGLDVQWLPEGEITGEFIKSLNIKPGILALEMDFPDDDEQTGQKEPVGLPFIVPGGRFNELYNWDSCFCAIGMIESHPHIVKSILRHFIFEIKHYGKILNANRSYYLGRAQPPFLTDLAIRTYEATKHEAGAKELLRGAILAAMKEYNSYWMSEPRLDPETGLSRYRPIGSGIPPECESTHFSHVLAPYAKKYNMTLEEIATAYNDGAINEPDLDTFFLHDRGVRESGHDTSNRLEGLCGDLATVDLNSLLYRYETDIATIIQTHFSDALQVPAIFCSPGQEPDHIETSSTWVQRASARKSRMDAYCWNESQGLYFDYNTSLKTPTTYESITTLWPLWAGLSSPHQASLLVSSALPKFEQVGGLTSTSLASRGPIDGAHPQKQWDYPYGWPPHQILAWDGLRRYGYEEEAERIAYRWLHMMTRTFREWNGTVVEKYDVTDLRAPHKVDAEYGNQGLGFEYAPQEGYVFFSSLDLGFWGFFWGKEG